MAINTTLLIDGDIFLYNACLGAEYEMQCEDDTHVLASDFNDAKAGFLRQLNAIKRELQTDNVRIAFTKDVGQNLFRYKIYPEYKNNRVNKRKPLCFTRLREEIEKEFTCLSVPGLEADDILGIWATRDAKYPYVIVSEDKDLKTIPGQLYRQGELLTISEAEADYNWLMQTLTGDVTDGYPGCPGIGPKKAEKILGGPITAEEQGRAEDHPPGTLIKDLWPLVVETYEQANLTPEHALTQARLARILRSSDWDAKKKEVILWTPPFQP